ncbi:unnamed protein product, partial [Leptidea sinapis]
RLKALEEKVQVIEQSTQDNAKQLKDKLTHLEHEQIEQDQWMRLNNAEIKGVPMKDRENLFEVVSKIGAKVRHCITKKDINFLARVPSKNTDAPKPIIVSFVNRYMKEDFIEAARAFGKLRPVDIDLSGSHNIFINDHLTVANKILLKKAKDIKNERQYAFLWIKNAKIFARKNPESKWNSSAEDIWVTVKMRNKRRVTLSLNICVLYLCTQKRGNYFAQQLNNFCANLKNIVSNNSLDKCLIVGDFNMCDIQWEQCGTETLGFKPSGIADSNTMRLEFIELMNECNLYQFNAFKNSIEGVLDLVFCNDFVSVLVCPDPLVAEDMLHPSLIIEPLFVELDALEVPKRTIYTYYRGEYDKIISHLLDMDWEILLNVGTVEDAPSSGKSSIDFTPCSISSIEISTAQVYKELKRLDVKKSAGPDTIPALFLTICARELSVPVSILFQRSLKEGLVPN